MRRADVNFWTDTAIGVAFAASAVSGIAFLLPVSGDSALGVAFSTWTTVHTWSSLAVVAGVVAHLALHWKWVTQMARRNLAARLEPVTATPQPEEGRIGRRAFLRYAALGAAFTGAAAVSARLLRGDSSAGGESDAATEATEATGGFAVSAGRGGSTTGRLSVACRKGVTYCPYPGRCHSFRDTNGDGYCDLSIPT